MRTQILLCTALAASLAACGAADDPMVVETETANTAVESASLEVPRGYDNSDDDLFASAAADGYCSDFGPQTPRDISAIYGMNRDKFPIAPASSELNLCNIHTHTNAEHRGPGFSVAVETDDEYGGFACNDSDALTDAELAPYEGMDYGNVKPGDTIEVHWVHTSCDIEPGEGLGSCLSETCTDPALRVETQVFLLVNDRSAGDFMEMAEVTQAGGMYQPGMIPANTGDPVVFRGSTTGPSYDAKGVCSPLKVTWSVRPECSKLDIASLDAWAESGNVFAETESHGVRPLVQNPLLLSEVE